MAHAVYRDLPCTKHYVRDSLSKLTAAERDACVDAQRTQGALAWPGRWVERRPTHDEVYLLAMFPQSWESTALGFGGVGGQAGTSAYTVVLVGPDGSKPAYFNSEWAYLLKAPASQDGVATGRNHDTALMEDVGAQQAADVLTAVSRYGAYRRPEQRYTD